MAATESLFVGGGELGELMRALDWSSTSLGPPDQWPQSLRSYVQMLLTSHYQMWLGWGPDLTFLYNDAYRPTLGVKHPRALGRPFAEVWKEVYHLVEPLVDEVRQTGRATFNEGMLLLLERAGFPEETYHTFSYSPLFDDDGQIAGMLCVVQEETERILSERRLKTLRNLGSATASTNNEAELFREVQTQLATNLHDLPFSLSYLVDAQGIARLVAAAGIDASHEAAPREFAIDGEPWPVSRIGAGAQALNVDDLAERFASLPCGAWDRPAR